MADAQRFGRYRVTRPLGAGGMGEVFEAVDEVLGREVAIKTLRSASGVAARFIDERFRNEARAIAQLSHPGVVQVFDIALDANPPFLVMERVAGPALDVRLERGTLTIAELVPLGIQIARALAAAHAAGIIHRDVKPGNVLAAGDGAWKLADFGVAHVPDSSLTMTGQFVGSPAYAPPEALLAGIVSPAGDVYGLGATLYEAACGRWPRLEAKGALLAPAPPLRELAPHLPPHLAAAIDRAVVNDRELRPTANELAELIAGATSVDTRRPHAHPRRWQPWAFGGVIAFAVVLAITVSGSKPHDTTAPPPAALPTDRPGELTFRPPVGLQGKAAKEWSKVVDHLYRHDYTEALHKLDQWEAHFGQTPETADLRSKLEALPPEPDRDHRRGDD